MSVALVAPGIGMRIGLGRLALWRSLRANVDVNPSQPPGNSLPTTITGLGGWWDAADLGGLLDSSGQSLTAWYQAMTAVLDKSDGTQPLVAYSSAPGTAALSAVPRLAGILGGAGAASQGTGLKMPALSPYHGLSYSGPPPGSGGPWTWWVVWSRPNWRQGTNADSQAGTVLSVGQVPILQIDNSGGAGRLVLFPSQANAVVSTALTRRHTHSVVLRSSVTTGVDVWLDGNLALRGVQNSLAVSPGGPTYLLHDGTAIGSAQCWFHEAATWQRALTDAEISTLLSHATRWPAGPRRGVTLVVNGQSNSVNYALYDGAALLLAQGIAWYLGAAAYDIVASTGAPTSYTMQSGHGIYPAVGGLYLGSFLAPDGTGATADPATWPLGFDGVAVSNALLNLSTEDLSDICALLWPWSETDSLRNYSEKSTFIAAATRFLTLERGMIGKDAARLPLIWWNAIPYGSAPGIQMHREATSALAAAQLMNVVIGNPQTSDSNSRTSTWDATTGISSGGDIAHRDADDNRRFAMLAAPIAARAILAAGYGDTIMAIPAGAPILGGPQIVHAFRRDDSSLVLTVLHDRGTDIKIPLQAVTGIGFGVMDGGSITNPGSLVLATSCQRVDSTHLLITLAQALRNPSASCGLYYPYGPTPIGRGNAVTDNYSLIAKPAGSDISADLGTAWKLDFPLGATTTAVPISDTIE